MLEYFCAYLQFETRQICYHKTDNNDLLNFVFGKDQLQDKNLSNEKKMREQKENFKEDNAKIFLSNFHEFKTENFEYKTVISSKIWKKLSEHLKEFLKVFDLTLNTLHLDDA